MAQNILNIIQDSIKIIKDQTANKGEFKLLDGNFVEEGTKYHIYFTKVKEEYFYTESEYNPEKSVEIFPEYDITTVGKYVTAKKLNPPITIYLKNYKVKPTEEDYSNGYMVRYFARLSNNPKDNIIELNKRNYLKRTKLYTKVELKWKLTGTRQEVEEANKKSIEFAERTLPNLHLRLENLVQFWPNVVDKKTETLKKIEVYRN